MSDQEKRKCDCFPDFSRILDSILQLLEEKRKYSLPEFSHIVDIILQLLDNVLTAMRHFGPRDRSNV